MRKQTIFLIYSLLLMGVFFVFASSCEKDDDNNNDKPLGIPVLSTSEITHITQTTASSGGNITSDAGSTVTARGMCWSTRTNPSIAGYKTIDGDGAGSFTSELTGLTAGTTYYARSYATNRNGTGYGSAMSFQTVDSSFTDPRDGNVYKIVIIGNQVWMAENLRYLPSVTGPDTSSQTVPYFYVSGYNGTVVADAKATANYSTYGVLYNWPAAMNGEASGTANPSGVQGICPVGWHLPSDAEWYELIYYLGGDAGGKLKETDTTHWKSPNTGATNEFGFTALPGGYRNYTGYCSFVGYAGRWWSATGYSAGFSSWGWGMDSDGSNVVHYAFLTELGFSVRCVQD